MTIEELRALVVEAQQGSNVAWDELIELEELTGILKQLNDSSENTERSYAIAIAELAKQAPDVDIVRHMLSGARAAEEQRGGEQNAREALESLTIYEDAPYHGESLGSSWATAVSVST